MEHNAETFGSPILCDQTAFLLPGNSNANVTRAKILSLG